MKTSIFYSPNYLIITLILFTLSGNLIAQNEDDILKRTKSDTTDTQLNMDAVYNRPALTINKAPVSIGGYLEANSIYAVEDGLTEGLSFQARRLTLFLSASINKRIKFLTEVEFEEGGKEIAIEFAAMDISFDPLLNLRGGIILNPIGAFNQNHDGPKWEFVERPDVAVKLLPATFSNAGFGMYGKTNTGDWIIGYEAYLSNGFDNSIINNSKDRTSLSSVKENEERFEENFSGDPLITTKLAIGNRNIGEVGFSYMGGTYNRVMEDGLQIDEKNRRVDVFAIDLSTTIESSGTYIVGEGAYVWVDVPKTFTQQFGNKQAGFFLDVVQPVLQKKMFGWENASLNVSVRTDYVDFNIGNFTQTNTNIGDDLIAVTPSISFRPSPATVLRLNYRYQWQNDILNNPATKTATWYLGFSTYF